MHPHANDIGIHLVFERAGEVHLGPRASTSTCVEVGR